MIKKFDDGSYLELRKADNSNEAVLGLCSVDPNNANIVSVTSVVINIEDLQNLINEVSKEK